MPTCVAITSLLKNREQYVLYCIFVIAVDLRDENVKIFEEFESVWLVDIKIIRKTAQNLKQLHTFDNKAICVASISALLKFVLPNILSDLDKVLYIDGDVIIQKGLLELYNKDIKNFYSAAIKDSGRIYYIIKGTEHLKNYFNSGVLLLNLKKLRQEFIHEILIKTKKILAIALLWIRMCLTSYLKIR
jgi:lipopolysaccharide biosynthesis glycosyltransferase